MAFTYGDWESQPTLALKLSRGRLCLQEIQDKIDADTSSGENSSRYDSLTKLYDSIRKKLDALEAQSNSGGGMVNGGITFGHLGSARR